MVDKKCLSYRLGSEAQMVEHCFDNALGIGKGGSLIGSGCAEAEPESTVVKGRGATPTNSAADYLNERWMVGDPVGEAEFGDSREAAYR